MANITVTTNQQVIDVTTTGGVNVTNTTDTITVLPSGTLNITTTNTDRLVAGSNQVILNTNATMTFPNNVIDFGSQTADLKSSSYSELWYRNATATPPAGQGIQTYIWAWENQAGIAVESVDNGYKEWYFNANGTTQFPSYTFPYADGTANQILKTNGAGILSWFSPTDTNTTYTQNFSSTTGGANLNLVGSDSTTDTVKFASGTGVTVAYTDADTATVSIGQDVATTANPTFAGGTFGNITVGVATDQTITTTSGDLILNSTSGTVKLNSNGTLGATLTPITGFNPNIDFTGNIIKGAIRTGAGEATGDIFSIGGVGSVGVSIDNTDKVTDRTSLVMRNYGGSLASGNPRITMLTEAARGTAASPTNITNGNFLFDLGIGGYTSTGWTADIASTSPLLIRGLATEAWSSGTSNVGVGFQVFAQPTATTLTTTSQTPILNLNPQNAVFRSDDFIWRNGKTGTTQVMGLDISGNLILTGDLRVNGNDIQASDGNTNITLTSNTLTTFAGDVRINGNDLQSSTGATALTLSGGSILTPGNLTTTGTATYNTNVGINTTTVINPSSSASGTQVNIKTEYRNTVSDPLIVPQAGYDLGNFRFQSYSDTSDTYVLAGAVACQATENWTSTANGSKIIFQAVKQGKAWNDSSFNSVVIDTSPDSTTFRSDSFTFNNSGVGGGAVTYATVNSTAATFTVPVTTEITSATVLEGTTYTPAATVDNNISVQLNANGGGTTVFDLASLTGNSRGASYNILVYNNTGSGAAIQVKNTRINSNNLMTHTITTGSPRIIINAYVVGDYATADHLVVA